MSIKHTYIHIYVHIIYMLVCTITTINRIARVERDVIIIGSGAADITSSRADNGDLLRHPRRGDQHVVNT